MIELAFVRNKLAKKKFGELEKNTLEEVMFEFKNSKSPFSPIVLDALSNCISDIQRNDFESASAEINLVHNLPGPDSGIEKWDRDYFFDVELPTYIKTTQHEERAKKAKELFGRVAALRDRSGP